MSYLNVTCSLVILKEHRLQRNKSYTELYTSRNRPDHCMQTLMRTGKGGAVSPAEPRSRSRHALVCFSDCLSSRSRHPRPDQHIGSSVCLLSSKSAAKSASHSPHEISRILPGLPPRPDLLIGIGGLVLAVGSRLVVPRSPQMAQVAPTDGAGSAHRWRR